MSQAHQQVALASFLAAARDHGAQVYYDPADDAAESIQDAAGAVGCPIVAMRPGDPAPAGQWAWTGSHRPEADGACQRLLAFDSPPVAVLCLSSIGDGWTGLGSWPPGHRAFITGQPWLQYLADASER